MSKMRTRDDQEFCSNCGALLKQNYSPADRNPTYRQNQDGRRVRAWAPEHEEPAEKDTVRDDTGRTDADGLEPFIRGKYIETDRRPERSGVHRSGLLMPGTGKNGNPGKS